PAALPSHVNAAPVAVEPGALKLIGCETSNLKVIVPSLSYVAEIAGQEVVASVMHTRESSVPVAVGSRRPSAIRGVTCEFGGKVSNETKTFCAFPFVSFTPNRTCHSEFSGRITVPVFRGSRDCTFMTNVIELSVQLAIGSPMLSR